MDASKSEPRDPCSLSIHRAFVIRVFGCVDAELAGQVEHVVSGDASEFRSADELLEFIRCVLRVHPPDHS